MNNMNPQQQRTMQEVQELNREAITDKEIKTQETFYQAEAKKVKTKAELVKELAMAKQGFIDAVREQTNLYYDYQRICSTDEKIKALEEGKKAEYTKQIKDHKTKLKELFKQTKILDIKRLAFHKELEKRVGFVFELGQNEYMQVYLGILCNGD